MWIDIKWHLAGWWLLYEYLGVLLGLVIGGPIFIV
jgi:hypothetical protein